MKNFIYKIFSVREVYRLATSYIILRFFGFKIKIIKENPISWLLLPFRKSFDDGNNNKVILIDENNNQKEIKPNKLKGIYVSFYGDNNTLLIDKSCKLVRSEICFSGSNSTVKFDKNCIGKWKVLLYCDNSNLNVGQNTEATDIQIVLLGNKMDIGKDCLISNNVRVLTDAHSVLDLQTNEVLNKPNKTIKIGDHVWIGERVTLTKNASIPNDCVVGVASVVTKEFHQEHSVIAGVPAKIVKDNITWNK